MTLHVLRADESIAVTPGGRVRILAPAPARASTSARDPSGGDGDDSIDVGGRLHGYVVRGEVTETPALICRGLVEGTTWEELHADLASLEDDGNGDEDDVTSRWMLRRPSHGGCFLVAALDKHRTFRLRTDTLGRCPVLVRDFGEGDARVDPGVHTRRRRAAREGRLEMPSPSTHLNNQPNRSDGPDVHRPQPAPHTEQHGTLHERYGRPASNPRS